jgi:hypothetical protein
MGLEGLVGCAGLQRLRSYGAVATAQTQKRERAGVPGNVRSARFSVGDFVFAPGHVARPPQPEGWTTNQLPSRRATGARCSTRDASNGDQDGGDPQPTLTQRRREDADRAGVPGNVRSARFSVEDLVFAPGHVARPPQPEGWTTNQMPSRRAPGAGSTRDASNDDRHYRAPQSTSTQRRGEDAERAAGRATFVVHASAWGIWYLRLAMWHVPPQPEGWTTNQMPSRRAPGARCSTRDTSNGDRDGRAPQSFQGDDPDGDVVFL